MALQDIEHPLTTDVSHFMASLREDGNSESFFPSSASFPHIVSNDVDMQKSLSAAKSSQKQDHEHDHVGQALVPIG